MSDKITQDNPILAVARSRSEDGGAAITTLSTGYRVYIRPPSASLIDEVISRIEYPDPPMWNNPDRVSEEFPDGRPEPNPAHPDYLAAITEVDHARNAAGIEAAIMFGVELVDPMPADDLWIRKLARLGIVVNTEDPLEVELAYKKYIVVGHPDIALLSTGLRAEDVDQAGRSFRRNQKR